METVALSLVSHTNVGKTTLARTLLRRDVGTVFDQAHVTELAEAWTLLETERARLVLWDTPGFGDTARLLRRLRREGDPLGWFLHQVWDRVTDRPLWCSQEALRNIREQADVVLYLVNAAEDPEEAGYVALELELLGHVGKPVLVLLNQTGSGGEGALLDRWKAWTGPLAHVRGVLSLDAFTRSWVQESLLLRSVGEALPEARRALLDELAEAWAARNLGVFRQCTGALAVLLVETAEDREPLPSAEAGAGERKRAVMRLAERLEGRLERLMEQLIAAHGLDGVSAARLKERLEDVRVEGTSPMDVRKSALWGGLVSGAASGLAADLAAGGLSFGGGLLVGAVLGALGGAGLARGVRLVTARGQPAVSWNRAYLATLVREVGLRYLAVAQFGRGRGAFHDDVLEPGGAGAAPWVAALDVALTARKERFDEVWQRLAAPSRAAGLLDVVPGVIGSVKGVGRGVGRLVGRDRGSRGEAQAVPGEQAAVPGAGPPEPAARPPQEQGARVASPSAATGPENAFAAAERHAREQEGRRRLERLMREALGQVLRERHPEAAGVMGSNLSD